MTNSGDKLRCQLGCWGLAALVGLVTAVGLSFFSDALSVTGAIFIGLLAFVVAGILFGFLFCRPLPPVRAPGEAMRTGPEGGLARPGGATTPAARGAAGSGAAMAGVAPRAGEVDPATASRVAGAPVTGTGRDTPAGDGMLDADKRGSGGQSGYATTSGATPGTGDSTQTGLGRMGDSPATASIDASRASGDDQAPTAAGDPAGRPAEVAPDAPSLSGQAGAPNASGGTTPAAGAANIADIAAAAPATPVAEGSDVADGRSLKEHLASDADAPEMANVDHPATEAAPGAGIAPQPRAATPEPRPEVASPPAPVVEVEAEPMPAAKPATPPEPAPAVDAMPAEPVAQAKPQTLTAARDGLPDDLKMIKGVGPKLEAMLHRLGFYHFDQVASWTDEEVAWVDQNLEGFKGRVSRDNWVSQARVLADGGSTDFSTRVGKGGMYPRS
ncbi:MAG: hypothetical protein ACU0BF_12180 [Paracoccaceae bacterium]